MTGIRLMAKSVAIPLAIALLATSFSFAQDQKKKDGQRKGQRQRGGNFRGGFGFGGRGGGLNKLSLVANEAVQKEIKVTEEQKGSIKELTDLYRGEQRDLYRSLRDLSDEERAKKREQFQKSTEETTSLLAEVLEDGQTKRLDQIILQLQGIRALRDEKVTKQLGVSKEQMAKLKSTFEANDAVQRKRIEEFRRSFASFRDLSDEERQKLRERAEKRREEAEKERKKFDTDVLALLTDEQKKKFESMKGAKFDMPRRSFGRGGQRPGGGRPQGNSGRPKRPDSN